MNPSPIDMRHLARQQESLRRMVHALVGDEHAAEDAVQDAWVRALESGLREPGQGWFATVARRLASNSRRGRRRRGERESLASRSEALPSSAQIAERVEIETRVMAALEGLDEPHRTALRDRYLGELTPTELARRDGVPLETVKSRLGRARVALRAKLDREGLGRDVHWSILVLPLLTRPELPGPALTAPVSAAGGAPLAGGLGTTVVGGTLAMKKIVVALAVVLVSIAAWRITNDTGARPAGPVEAPGLAPTGAVDLAPTKRDIDSASPLDAVAAADEAPAARRDAVLPVPEVESTWRIAGRARHARGDASAVGVAFALAVHAGYDSSGESLHEATVTSGTDGRFELLLPDPGRTVTVTIGALPTPDRAVVTYGPYLVVRGEEPPSAIDVLVFSIDAHMAGVVRDTSGRGIAGCEVRGLYGEATSDPEGRYRMRIASSAWGDVTASAEGFGVASKVFEKLQADATTEVDFLLEPGIRVEGTVRAENGAPLAGVPVQAYASGTHRATTDRAGHYALTRISVAQDSFTVHAMVDGRVPASAVVELEAGRTTFVCDLELARGVAAAGRVVDPEGNPIAGVEVWMGRGQYDWGRKTAISRDDGRFAMDCVGPGSTKLGAEKRGFAPFLEIVEVPEVGGARDLLVQFAPSRTVRGVVHDRAGKGLSGVSVSAQLDREYVGARGRTDDEGRFEVNDLPAGPLTVQAYGRGLVRVDVPVPERGDVEVVMERAGALAGKVLDAGTGEPIPNFTVRFVAPLGPDAQPRLSGYSSSWARPGKSFTTTDGNWATGPYDELQPGAYIGLEVRAEGYAPALLPTVRVPEYGDESVILHELGAPLTVELAVSLTGTGAPVSGATIEASTVRHPQDGDLRWAVRTDDAGTAVLEDAAPGPLFVRVLRADRPPVTLGPLEVPAGARHAVLPLEVPAGARVEVTLADADGAPLANRAVILIAIEVEGFDHEPLPGTTDASGVARFEGLGTGTWQVSRLLREGDHKCYDLSGLLNVSDGDDVVRFELRPPGRAVVRGRLEGELRVPDGTCVTLLRRDVGGSLGALARDGAFEATGLAPGRYLITVNFWDPGTSSSVMGNTDVVIPGDGDVVETTVTVAPRTFR